MVLRVSECMPSAATTKSKSASRPSLNVTRTTASRSSKRCAVRSKRIGSPSRPAASRTSSSLRRKPRIGP